MRKPELLLGLMVFALSTAQAECPFLHQALPRNVVLIASPDEMDPQCRNAYQALSPDNPCDLDTPSRVNIASNFYQAWKEYRKQPGADQCRGTGPKTSQVMSCLINSSNQDAFSDCLGIGR
jgi:hypothetical protein